MKTKIFVGSLTSAIRNAVIVMAGIALLMTITSSAFAQTNWVTSSSLPADAIVGGQESNGTTLYVCHGGTREGFGLQPGKYSTVLGGCDFGYKGKEYDVSDFEYLVSSWQNESGGSIPSNAVVAACPDPDVSCPGPPNYYYCRASIPRQSGLAPGKITSGYNGCHVSFAGQELIETSYQVLVALSPAMPLYLVNASDGNVPFGAVQGGSDTGGQPLYMCVANYANNYNIPGKVRPQFGACYIPYGGREVAVQYYEVLVPGWVAEPYGGVTPDFQFPTGLETNETPLFTCRAYFQGGIHPGSTPFPGSKCSFGWGGEEQSQYGGFDLLSDYTVNPK